MTKSIHQKIFYPQPPEVVWEYLTRADLMALWLMENDFMPVIGHEFRFCTKPIPSLNFDGIFYCKVLELVAPKKLVYSWKGGPEKGTITVDTVVLWTLHAKDNGTELVLEQSGFKEAENFNIYTAMTDGWQKNMQKISVLINEGKHGTANV